MCGGLWCAPVDTTLGRGIRGGSTRGKCIGRVWSLHGANRQALHIQSLTIERWALRRMCVSHVGRVGRVHRGRQARKGCESLRCGHRHGKWCYWGDTEWQCDIMQKWCVKRDAHSPLSSSASSASTYVCAHASSDSACGGSGFRTCGDRCGAPKKEGRSISG